MYLVENRGSQIAKLEEEDQKKGVKDLYKNDFGGLGMINEIDVQQRNRFNSEGYGDNIEKMENVDDIPQPQICSSHHDSRDMDDPDFDDNFDDDEDDQQQMMWDDDEQYIPENVPPIN